MGLLKSLFGREGKLRLPAMCRRAKTFKADVCYVEMRALPFHAQADEIIYVEDGCDPRINECIARHLPLIQQAFGEHFMRFSYLPALGEELRGASEVWAYRFPDRERVDVSNIEGLPNNFLLRFMSNPQNRSRVAAPALMCLVPGSQKNGDGSETLDMARVQFDPEEMLAYASDAGYWRFMLSAMQRLLTAELTFYRRVTEPDADGSFDDEVKTLMDEVRYKISQLSRMGVSEACLYNLVRTSEGRLSRLRVTADFRVILSDYHQTEVCMTPLVKAVYLLFLRHPEGIRFKELVDYREELAYIYDRVMGSKRSKSEAMNRRYDESIMAATDPLNNSINEKCARIREAFLLKIHDMWACHYYVSGQRGEPKRVALPADMVDWEADL